MPSAVVALPPAKQVRDQLGELLGREVALGPGAPVLPGPRDPALVAVFVGPRLRLAGLLALDARLSVAVGATHLLLPPAVGSEALAHWFLPPLLVAGARDVVAGLGGLFAGVGEPPRLHAVHAPGELPPADVSAWLRVPGPRRDLRVSVAGYGGGRLSLVIPPPEADLASRR